MVPLKVSPRIVDIRKQLYAVKLMNMFTFCTELLELPLSSARLGFACTYGEIGPRAILDGEIGPTFLLICAQ